MQKTEKVQKMHESDDKQNGSKKTTNDAILSIFRPDPTSFFGGPLEKEFAKSFYNRSE